MELNGEQRIPASRERVWEALNDAEVLRRCIPGCQSLEREADDRFAAIAEVRIGPIGARFKGAVELSGIDPPNGYVISGKGNGGIAGNAQGTARVRLADDAGGGTLLSYRVEADVGGRMAQLGGPIIDATARNLASTFFDRFAAIIVGEPAAPVPAAIPSLPAAAAPAPVTGAIPAPLAVRTALWGWVAALLAAILVGYFLGINATWGGTIVLVMVLLVIVAAAAYEAGRRGGGR